MRYQLPTDLSKTMYLTIIGKIESFTYELKHNNCMFNPLRHKKLIKNQIKSSKLIYDNTFTNKKPRKN